MNATATDARFRSVRVWRMRLGWLGSRRVPVVFLVVGVATLAFASWRAYRLAELPDVGPPFGRGRYRRR